MDDALRGEEEEEGERGMEMDVILEELHGIPLEEKRMEESILDLLTRILAAAF